MTLLDLIRSLHEQGNPVVDYDVFVAENSACEMEDIVDSNFGMVVFRPKLSLMMPPGYIELGDKPRYLYIEDLQQYLRVTHATENIPKAFPRLLVGIFTDVTFGFLPRYGGKNWREIPPIEIQWQEQNDLLLPALDAAGNLCGIVYDGEIAIDAPATYYRVRTPYGSDFAWQGDLSRDPLPEGLRIVGE